MALDTSKDGIELDIVSRSDDSNSNAVDETSLRHIPGRIPKVSYLICFVEFSERLSYYLIQGCITNMIQRKLPHNSTTGAVVDDYAHSNESPGALGLGLPTATFLLQLMSLTANLSPVFSGYYADTKLGRFNSIVIGTIVGIIGHLLLVVAAIPIVIQVVPLSLCLVTLSLIIVAISAGFIKPNLMPLLMDQYTQEDSITMLDSGEKVVVERKATLERATLIYYFFINIGCFLAFIGSFIERRFGFWVVYFLTVLVYMIMPFLLWYLKPRLKIPKPSGVSVFDSVIPLLKCCFSRGWFHRFTRGEFWSIQPITTGITISDLHKTFQNCVMFLYFIIFNVNDSALTPLQINQAGSMRTDGMPNDLFQSFNPLAIMILIPFQDSILYPYLRKKRIQFTSIDKITFGFILTSLGSIFGAILQKRIYDTNKCGDHATTCDTVSPITAWWCAIMFSLQACGECFATVTCYEMAYSRSPPNMRSFVVALFLASTSLSSIIGEIISWWAYDPNLVKIFAWCGSLGLISAVIFAIRFYSLRKEELQQTLHI